MATAACIRRIGLGMALTALLLAPSGVLAADNNSLSPQASPGGTTQANAMISDALALMRANKNQAAADELKRVIDAAPNIAEAHHNYALALAKLGDTNGAIAQFNEAIRLRPDLDSSWLTLAGLHQSVGHIDEAIALYNQFLQRFSNRSDLRDTRKKIEQLVAGLQQENSSMKAARDGTVALAQGTPAGRNNVLQPAAQTAPAADDYIPEATHGGSIVCWPTARMPIKVCIHSAEGVPNYKQQWRDILMSSFKDWQSASQGSVKFAFVQPGEDADIDCYFVADPSRDNGGLKNDAEAGEANMFMDKDGLKKGTIKLLTKSLSTVLPLTDNRMRVICLHEIGHALGLAGHTANPEDIMFYSTSFKDEWRDLSGRDARTIQRLYQVR